MKIEVFFNPTCPVCPHTKKLVEKVVKRYHEVQYEKVNAFENQDRVIKLGFETVPAIGIDGQLWHTGIPDKKALKKEIELDSTEFCCLGV